MKTATKNPPAKNAYTTSEFNSKIYANWRNKFTDFFPSERYWFEGALKDIKGISVLDVGGGAGGLGTALLNTIDPTINYTCVDPDKNAIELGRKADPRLKLVHGYFPGALKGKTKYDMVTMYALFPQLEDWKGTLRNLKSVSKKYVNFTCGLQKDYPTTVDIDTSYVYYFESNKRVHQVIHNVYQLLNFISLSEMEVKKISFYGYHIPNHTPDSFRSIANNRIIFGNMLLEIEEGRYDQGRTGGCSQIQNAPQKGIARKNVRPELEIIIDGKVCRNYNEIDAVPW